MSLEVKVKTKDIADDSGLRTTRVKLANNYVTTPIKSVDTSSFYADTKFPKQMTKLSEFFLSFNENTLKRFYNDDEYNKRKNYDFNSHKKKIYDDTTTITIVQYKKTRKDEAPADYEAPSEKEIKSLVNAAYSFTDITAIPSVPRLARRIDVDDIDILMDYIDSTLKRINVHNKKKVMGYLPMLPPAFLERLVNYYLNNGINALYLDFDGTTLTSNLSKVDTIKRTLADRGYEENHFLYYVNMSYGKAINEIGVLSARDLLALSLGLDGFGGKHVAARRGKEFYEWIKKQKDTYKNKTRILNRTDYGYYRYSEDHLKSYFETEGGLPNPMEIYPEDPIVDLSNIIEKDSFTSKKRLIDIENVHQRALECNNLGIITHEKPDETINYFDKKKCVKNKDIKQIKRKS